MASRADVAVSCSSPGTYNLINEDNGNVIATVEVTGTAATAPTLTTFNPLRPRYLQSLLFYEGSMNMQTIQFRGGSINNQQFTSEDNYLFEITSGEVQEWNIRDVQDRDDETDHPYHVHVNHFQTTDCGDGPTGWSNAGDWLDTMGFDGTVRFHTDTFGGHVVIHCHRLEHEDLGLMGVVYIHGGCDANYADIGGDEYPACEYDETCVNASFSNYDWAVEAEGFNDTCG